MFFTSWTGFFNYRVSSDLKLEFILETEHQIGDNFSKRFKHTRHYIKFVRGNTLDTLPLNVFDSKSSLKAGTVNIGGQFLTITEEDFIKPTRITYNLIIRAFDITSDRQIGTNLLNLHSDNIQTISFQFR